MNQVTPIPKPPKPIKDKKYLGLVKQLRCVICTNFDGFTVAPYSDAHHTICGRFSQTKTSDRYAIPLCKGHHQTGEDGKLAIHLHRKEWVEAYGPDTDYIEQTIDKVFEAFGYLPKGVKQ